MKQYTHDPARSDADKPSPLIQGRFARCVRSWRWWLWVVYWCAEFVVTHIRIPPRTHLPPMLSDKIIHAALYALLVVLGTVAARARFGRNPTATWYAVWACVYIVYGGLDEWLQQFVHRTASLGDWLADAIGVVLATLVLASFYRHRSRPRATTVA